MIFSGDNLNNQKTRHKGGSVRNINLEVTKMFMWGKMSIIYIIIIILFSFFKISYVLGGHYDKGKEYLLENKYELAIKEFIKASKENENPAELYELIGACYRSINNYDKSISYYDQAIQINPRNSWAQYILGKLYGNIGRYEDSVKHLEISIKLNPKFIWARINLVPIYYYLQKYDEVKEECNKILELDPNNRDAMWYFAYVEHINLQYDEAEIWYMKLRNLEPKNINSYLNLWKVYADKGMPEEGIKYLEESKILFPENKFLLSIKANAHYDMGRYYDYKRNFDKAEIEYKKCLLENPEYIKAHFGLARVYYLQKKWGKAIKEHKAIPNTHILSPEAYYGIGVVYYERANKFGNKKFLKGAELKSLAVKMLKKSLDLKQDFIESHYMLGNVYYKLDAYDLAEEEYKKVEKINPKFYNIHYKLGCVYWKKQLWDRCIEEWEKELEINPNHASAKEWLPKAREKYKESKSNTR